MPSITVTLTETIEVPEGTKILSSGKTGVALGFQLPDGTFLKPWPSYEVYEDLNADATIDNATTEDLQNLDVHQALDLERTIDQAEGPVETVEVGN